VVVAFGGNGQDAVDVGGVLGMGERGEGEQ
jgi:hypothetical protein